MIYRFHRFEIDEDKRELRVDGGIVEMQPRVFDLLVYLAMHRERVVPKDELLDAVWPGVTVADGALQRAISVARSALDRAGAAKSIRTYSRQGYRLCAEDAAPDGAVKAGSDGKTGVAHGLSADVQRRVHLHVDRIVRHPLFAGSPQLIAIFRYLIAEVLSGRSGAVTPESAARALNQEGDGRDPLAGLALRVEAGELRARLRSYYATTSYNDGVRIELPGGQFSLHVLIEGVPLEYPSRESKQDIRFLRARDGTSLAYAISGIGHPLIKAANWLSHLEYDYESPVWRHWWQALAERYQLVRYDERGCGLSSWDVSEFSVEAWLADLEAVVDHTAYRRFALLGISQGAAVAISYAARHPERVSHLVLYGGFAQGRLRRARTPAQKEEAKMLLRLVRMGWGEGNPAFRKVFASLFMPDGSDDQYRSFLELQRISTSPENAERFVDAFNRIDVVELARRVRVPTLVIHSRNELEIPSDQARLLARTIPNARLVLLDSRNHILSESEPAWREFLDEVQAFLG